MLSTKIAMFILVSIQAHGFTLASTNDSTMKGWANPEISFKLNPANCPASVEGIIGDAMSVWNGVPTSNVKLSLDGYTATDYAAAHSGTATDVPVIICDPSFSSHSPLGGNGVAGVALTATPPIGGHISYSFVLLNVESGSTGNISSVPPTSVSIVLAHELGHVLGLGHSPDASALMYYDATAKRNLSLSQDDIDGVTYLYPRNEPSDKIAGCGRMQAPPSGRPGSGTLSMMIAILLSPLIFAIFLKIPKPTRSV